MVKYSKTDFLPGQTSCVLWVSPARGSHAIQWHAKVLHGSSASSLHATMFQLQNKYILIARIYRMSYFNTLVTKKGTFCPQDWTNKGRGVVPPWILCDGEAHSMHLWDVWAPTSIQDLHLLQNFFFALILTMAPCTPTKRGLSGMIWSRVVIPLILHETSASTLPLSDGTTKRWRRALGQSQASPTFIIRPLDQVVHRNWVIMQNVKGHVPSPVAVFMLLPISRGNISIM